MKITPRMKQIFRVLFRENSPVSVRYLAEQVGVSKRTVQRELESVDSALKGSGIRFLSRTGVGVWLEGDERDRARFLKELESADDDYDVSNREERRKRLLLEMLKEKGIKKLFYYSNQFGVSEATISSDLASVEGWLGRYGLTVSRRPGSGVAVEGSEEDYRRAIRAFISENMDTHAFREAYEEADEKGPPWQFLKKSNIGRILNDEIMERVVDCILAVDSARFLTLTENSYMGLIIHISIAVNRILKNEVIEADERWKENIREDEDYGLAKAIVAELEEEFEIQIPEVEVSYICLHIKGSKHEKIQWDKKTCLDLKSRKLQQLVNRMIDAFDREQAYLLKQDDEFLQGLLAHLQPTLIRLNHGMQIHNPVLKEIRENYPDIYDRCGQAALLLEEFTGKSVPDEEVGFLTVHFGAAMVRLAGRREEIRRVAIGVVCSSGIGISRLMVSKLEKVFKDRAVLSAYGARDITPYVAGQADFFVSSVPLDVAGPPVIYVSPLLSETDMGEIRQMIYQFERLPRKQKESDAFSSQLERVNLAAAQIRGIIKYMEFFKVDNHITFDELLIAIGEKLSPYSDRRELIRRDILRREQISSQVFAEFGFALFHTRTRGVIRPGFSVCMTKDLGAFRDEYFKGISAAFIMLAPEDENVALNTEILGSISSMLVEEYGFMDIVRRGDREEIRDALAVHLKRFFNRLVGGIS